VDVCRADVRCNDGVEKAPFSADLHRYWTSRSEDIQMSPWDIEAIVSLSILGNRLGEIESMDAEQMLRVTDADAGM
jgi:hypothetical protein